MSGLRRAVALVACAAAAAIGSGCSGRPRRPAAAPPTSPAPVATTTTTTTPAVTYSVKAGDTLGAIARRFGLTVEAVAAFNKLADPNKLTEGQIITIPPTTTTTTTVAPPSTTTPAAKLVVAPASGAVGTVFQLTLTGALPAETVMFEIDGPGGKKFTGSAHTPDASGKVSTVYVTTAGDRTGSYSVVATGTLHTTAQATFTVTGGSAATTTATT